ncbi:MAG: Hpt domain-containing protein [Candidatus Scalindua sp.]
MKQDDQGGQEKIKVSVDPEIMDIVPGFLDNRKKDVMSMLEALENGDYETIRMLGHSMKGSGGGYGFDTISEIGNSIEQEAKNRNVEEIRRNIEELATYLERIEIVYE